MGISLEDRLFFSEDIINKWKIKFDKDYSFDTELKERIVDKGIVLPLRKREDIIRQDGCFAGGVCTENFEFVSGLRRNYEKKNVNLSCCSAYEVDKNNIKVVHETVVFGGILFEHFGDTIVNGTTYLWWFVEHQDLPYRYVFLMKPGCMSYPKEFFALLGLDDSKIIIVEHPTQFDNVIVPDEACFILSNVNHKWILPFEQIKKNVGQVMPPSDIDKIYLSRTHFQKYGKSDGINEIWYEKFFAHLGYRVIYPEELSLSEQINIIMGAKEIVSTFGTLTNMALFAQDGVKQIALFRTPELWTHQIIINYIRNIDWYWIDSTINPMVTKHDFGVFLYYPTTYFQKFLCDQNIILGQNLVENPLPDKQLIYSYIDLWAEHFGDPKYFYFIKDFTALDIVNKLNAALYGKYVDISLFPKNKLELSLEQKNTTIKKQREDLNKLRKKIAKLEIENDDLKKNLMNIKNSKSWRFTRPLRFIMRFFKH